MTCSSIKLSVLIATYNRAEVLRQTLESMCAVNRDGLGVEFVVIDNNSKDNTGEVIDSFKDRLPIRHLFQPRQGKSAALNLALDTVELGDILVFTDDDVFPRPDWFATIVSSCDKHPDYDIFGGPVDLVWPTDVPVPLWARSDFAQYVLGGVEQAQTNYDFQFTPSRLPAGPNTWFRALIIKTHRFPEGLGPGSTYDCGDDCIYVRELLERGHKGLCIGASAIGHLVHTQWFDKTVVRKRAFRRGLVRPILGGLSWRSLYNSFPPLWFALRLVSIARYGLLALATSIPIPSDRLFLAHLKSLWLLGMNWGQLRMGWQGDSGLTGGQK